MATRVSTSLAVAHVFGTAVAVLDLSKNLRSTPWKPPERGTDIKRVDGAGLYAISAALRTNLLFGYGPYLLA